MIPDSETLLCTLLEQTPKAIFILDVYPDDSSSSQEATLRFAAANEIYLHMLGIEDEIAQRTPYDCLPLAIADALCNHSYQCLKQRQSVSYETIYPLGQQSLHLQTTLIPVIETDGSIAQIVGMGQESRDCQLVETEGHLLHQTQTALGESQRKLANLINSLPGIVFTCTNDPDWSMAYMSEGCLNLTGYHSYELTGKQRQLTYNDLTHPDDLSGVLEAISYAVANQQTYVIEYRIRTKSGEEKWLWEKGQAAYNSDGQPISLEGFISDITNRKQAEEALRQSEARNRAILDAMPDLLLRLKPDGTCVDFIQPKDNLGEFVPIHHHLAEVLPPDVLQNQLRYMEKTLATGKPQIWEHQFIKRDRVCCEEVRIAPCGKDEVLVIVRDITQRKRDEAERKRAEVALRESEQRYQNLYDCAPDMYFSVNPSGIILSVNQFGAEYLGYTKTELIGKSILQVVHPKDRSQVQAQITHSFCDRIARNNLELRKIRKDGSVLWVYEQTQLTCDNANQPIELRIICRDITDHRQNQEALKQAEIKYRSIFENAVEGIFQTTPTGCYLTANSMLANIYGYNSPEELMATVTDIEHQLYVDHSRRDEFMNLLQRNNAVWGFESQIYRKDGSIIWILENARTIRDETGQLLGYEGTVQDISTRKQAEAELRQRDSLLQGVASATNHLLTETDFDLAITKALAVLGNAAGIDRVYIYENHPHVMTGEPAMSMRYEWVSESVASSIHQSHWQNQPYSTHGMTRWYQAFSAGHSISGIVREFPLLEQEILTLDKILSILLVPILIDEQLWGFIGFDDCHNEHRWSNNEESILVTMAASIGGAIKRQQAEATIRYQAFHDLLTDLPNRMLFNDRLRLALANAERNNGSLAVMFLDLDRFKTINDTLGHAIGDLLLQSVAQRLSNCLRQSDTIARWGGDEFTILLPTVSDDEDTSQAARRIINALKPAFYLEEHELYISSSIGIALYPQDGIDAQTLLKNADAALYRVKDQGRNSFQFYTPAINSKASERLVLDNSLHHALAHNQFLLYYQPQVNITTGEITRMEALLRWQHSDFGFISPGVFIPLAEENGLIIPIGEWVLRTACTQHKLWQEAGLPLSRMAVNLSARQFQQPELVEVIAKILQETQLDPTCLELEITETTAMQNVDFTRFTLNSLRGMGVRISMDDFGTGYSSLGYLKQFPLDTIKIDRSFVRELTTDANDTAIVNAVIALGQGLSLSVVAEGVETPEQLEYLRSLRCEEMQGFLFSKPLPAEEATRFLKAHRQKSLFAVSPNTAPVEVQSA